MPAKFYKILLILGIVLVLLAIPVFGLTYNPPSELEVDFLDVGQGDAILIKSPFGQNILIDGGPDNKVIAELDKSLPFWDKQIDLIILTHPHDDHVAGLIEVIKRYQVKKIIYTGVVHTSPNYLVWLELVANRKIPLIIADRPQTISLGEDCYLKILYPLESFLNKTVANLNNSSMVVKLVYKENKFLFTGDAEKEVEEELMANSFKLLPSDVLKLGHHGSDTSSSQDFLQLISPEIAIIQVGEDNDFGHPSRRIIKRLERLDVKILRTDIDGTVRLVGDGEKVREK